jgi:hypothetical protein
MEEENIDKQMLKARKGIIEIIAGSGGIMPMKDAHDFCESTYGVGHKRFSDLMEYCIEQGLYTYNREDNMIALTETGRNSL